MTRAYWTVPNLLSVIRLLGAPVALGLAVAGMRVWFMVVVVSLLMTDWMDGRLARWLHQRTELGATIDSVADVTLYGTLAVSLAWLQPDVLRSTWPWLVAVACTYALSVVVSIARFGRFPAFHTWGAKSAWVFAYAGALAAYGLGWAWPVAVAGAYVSLTNMEAVGIGLLVPEWPGEVPTLWHARRRRHRTPD